MPASRGLLARLSKGDIHGRSSSTDVQGIVEHLRFLLNTRVGEAVTVPDYGIQDLSDLSKLFPEAAEVWEHSIRDTIEKYEPRLTNVRVRHRPTDNPLIIAFTIVARLTAGDGKPIQLETQADHTGHFEIW
jgi:type VI secretion system protein